MKNQSIDLINYCDSFPSVSEIMNITCQAEI